MAKIISLILILLTFTLAKSFTIDSLETTVVPENNPQIHRAVWASIEYGNHSKDLGQGYVKSSTYEKYSIEIPLGETFGLCVFYDRLKHGFTQSDYGPEGHYSAVGLGNSHWDLGLGVSFALLQSGKLDFIGAPSILIGHYWGISIPTTVAYRMFKDKLRLQISVSFQAKGNMDPGGGKEFSFYTVSFGVGVALDRILSSNFNKK